MLCMHSIAYTRDKPLILIFRPFRVSTTMDLAVLGANDVERIVPQLSPETLVTLMATVFTRLSDNDNIAMPHRAMIVKESYTTLFMPSSLENIGTSVKIVSVPNSAMRGTTSASTLLLDEATGAAKALINAGKLTALRTAAGMCPPFSSRILLSFF